MLDRRAETHKDSLANDEVTNVEFPGFRDCRDGSDIVKGQAVSVMDFKPRRMGELSAFF